MYGNCKRARDMDIAEEDVTMSKVKNTSGKLEGNSNCVDELEFEDPFDDVFEEEDIVMRDADGNLLEEEDEDMDIERKDVKRNVYFPEDVEMKDMQLDYDSSAYVMLHRLNVEWPCFTFDIICDDKGQMRSKYPHSVQLVGGTCSADTNRISVFRVNELHKTKFDGLDEEEKEDYEDDDDDEVYEGVEAVVGEQYVSVPCDVNRVRSMPQAGHINATCLGDGTVRIWDLSTLCKGRGIGLTQTTPLFTFSGHKSEGFGLDWSRSVSGRLVSGDCSRSIHVWDPIEGGSWVVSQAYKGHEGSIEDLQWSPTEKDVFATCSTDRSIRFWDTRVGNRSCIINLKNVHESDVNALSWNQAVGHLVCSGGDDGALKIWDLRSVKNNSDNSIQALSGDFRWHNQPITCLEWHPFQESVIGVGSQDDSISIWDLGLEADEEEIFGGAKLGKEIPPQLIFLHRGQKDIKDIHFHTQIPSCVVSTAGSGIDIFKPDNL